jgi:hydrogenase maturation protein HypF
MHVMERRAIAISGTVQGVGFRPFVYGLASQLELCGFVRNQTDGVSIEVEGEGSRLDQFLLQLSANKPPLARIERVSWEPRPPLGDSRFRIETSTSGVTGPVLIPPDIATCDDCLRELFDPHDRRYRYPFLNCTNCGPRLTIVESAPYDRERTTMSAFTMCRACRAEYENPIDRRFHAQPIACPACGPRLALRDGAGKPLEGEDALARFADVLRGGGVGALKGLGGYHLACDATNDAAVAKLRSRKQREEKPFAVMVSDLDSARALCEIDEAERDLLCSPRRPIVLLRKHKGSPLGPGVAPGNPRLGLMLPYTPLHHLLLREMGGRPLVMTSGNRCDEPIAVGEPDVYERLAGIADAYLTHDRPIHVRCDDSVTRVVGGIESPLRRSRGYAPQPVRLPLHCRTPGLAVGGQLKATFGLARDDQAILSHHLGDLDNYEAYRAFERDVALFEQTFDVRPTWIAHDLHPDYASTHFALRRAGRDGLKPIAVQHHHAHMASCMAEHGLTCPVIGVCFDGTGFGPDGAVWGGEFLVGDLEGFRRGAHLRYVPMPGGEKAVREPWRMALAHCHDSGAQSTPFLHRIDATSARTAHRMIERRFNAPPTSSIGRLFDAVASLVGLRDDVTFEGQAAMELEWLATGVPEDGAYAFEIVAPGEGTAGEEAALVVDTRPLIRDVVRDVGRGVAAASIARRFHTTVVEIIVKVCAKLRAQTGLSQVVLSGGVFMNALLLCETEHALNTAGFLALRHRTVPANDGGLSLGQLAVAAQQLELR